MTEILLNQSSNDLLVKEENQLNWNKILEKLKKTFGNDIYESWIKNVNLKKEFNHYIILSAPTRFVRDWIVSRYADKILDIIKTFKKSIQRIEFLIDETQEKSDKSLFLKKGQVLYGSLAGSHGNIIKSVLKNEYSSMKLRTL